MPRAYSDGVAQEDGNVVDTPINESTDISSFVATGRKPAAGIRLNGIKFMKTTMVTDEETGVVSIYLRSMSPTLKGGGCVCKTNQAVIFGVWSEEAGQSAGGCNETVFKLANYLVANNF